MHQKTKTFTADLAKGVMVGAGGTWAMEKVTGFFWRYEGPSARERYKEVTHDRYPSARMAEKVEGLLRLDLPQERRMKLAQGLHATARAVSLNHAAVVVRDRPARGVRGILSYALVFAAPAGR